MSKLFRRIRLIVGAISGFCVGALTSVGALALGMTPLNAWIVSFALTQTLIWSV